MTNNKIGFERDDFNVRTEGNTDYLTPVSDPSTKAIKYVGECVRFGFQTVPDALGKVVGANSSEVLLMPYVSVLPIPGQSPAVALVTEGRPLSVNPSAAIRSEPVPEGYLEAYVLGYKSESKGREE